MKDRNNVAFYKSAMDQTLMKKPEKNLIEGNDKQLENKNKRQISPVSGGATKMIVSEGSESDGDDEDDEGWTLATGTRRKTSTELKTGQSAVTPIVIRRVSIGKQKKVAPRLHFTVDSDCNMEFEEYEESSEQIPEQPPVQIANLEGLGSSSVFFTSRPESGLRDVLTVECHKINGQDFKGTITYTEATVKIFQQELGLSTEILHSVNMSFGKYRTVSFKLKKQINIDEMHEKENFEMKRSYMKDNLIQTDVISCKIVGIRRPRTTPDVPRPQYDGSDMDIQLVEISGCVE